MATYEKIKLSGAGAKNAPTKITNINAHVTGTSSSVLDEVWLWVHNSSSVTRPVMWTLDGGTTPIVLNVPAYSTILAVPGMSFSGDGTNTASLFILDIQDSNNLFCYGYVNRITP
jgi:hypothetical protein